MENEKREETFKSRMNEIFKLIIKNVIPKLPEPIRLLVKTEIDKGGKLWVRIFGILLEVQFSVR